MSRNPILIDTVDGVATITLNAPEKLNAIDRPMGESLDSAFAQLGADPSVRVIVVTGAGRGFCAGASFDRLEEVRKGGDEGLTTHHPSEGDPVFSNFDAPPQFRTRYTIPLAIPKPVIAAVNGPCAGAGLVLALACDIRLASINAKFVASFAKLGLVAEGACAFLLPRLVGHGRASEILLSARTVAAPEARDIGLVSTVSPEADFMNEARAYAHRIATGIAASSTSFIKRQLQHSMHAPLSDSINYAFDGTQEAVKGKDFAEGIRAQAEKRPPRFSS